MKDRIPTKPGRIQLVPSADDDDLFILTRADEPTQAGTPLNKGSLLSDATAAMMNLTGEPTVNAALAYLADRVDTIKTGEGAPTSDITAHLGDIYIQDAGGARRTVYICDAIGEKPADIRIYWSQGSLNSDGTNRSTTYRVKSDMTFFPKGTKLSIASGFRFAVYMFDANKAYSSTVSFRTTAYTFGADTWARVLIARTSENISESAVVGTFASKLSITSNGSHWIRVGAAKTVQKQVVITQSCYWDVPDDLIGSVTIMAFGGGAGGSSVSGGYGGGGGKMSVRTVSLTQKRYEVKIGAGGAVGGNGGTTTFGSLLTAQGGSGQNGGSGGGGGSESGHTAGGNGSYGGGGGGYSGNGGNGGKYGGGGGGGHILSGNYSAGSGGSGGENGAFPGGAGYLNTGRTVGYGGGGGGYAANGSAATSSANGNGGAGFNTNGFSLDFEGSGAAGTNAGGGGGYGGNGGSGSNNTSGAGGGGGGYGTGNGGSGGTAGGGGGGGWGGKGGNGGAVSPGLTGGGGGGGYGLSGNGGAPGVAGGLAAGGGCGAPGGPGVVVITYTGVEAV